MKKLFLFLLLNCAVSFSQTCTISGLSCLYLNQTTSYSTVATSGYSYFWSVTGGLSIVGSNTGSTISVTQVSSTPGQICLTKYKTGSMPCCECKNVNFCNTTNCPLHIVETHPMCNSTVTIEGRGFYTIYDCNNIEKPNLGYGIVWRILEDPNKTKFSAASYTNGDFRPCPIVNLPGNQNFTIQLLRQSNNEILASFVTTVGSCPGYRFSTILTTNPVKNGSLINIDKSFGDIISVDLYTVEGVKIEHLNNNGNDVIINSRVKGLQVVKFTFSDNTEKVEKIIIN